MRLSAGSRLICCDADEDALIVSRQRLQQFGDRVLCIRSNFAHVRDELRKVSVQQIGGLLLDLGVSSFQLNHGSKGFSFRTDDLLDMRLDRRQQLTARDVVNTYSEDSLARLIKAYGEERFARTIAKRIVTARPLETTGALSKAIASVAGGRYLTKTLARVFQALRIEVNRELENLTEVLDAAVDLLESGGRLVVISYHSLEDRIVKDFYRAESATSIPSTHKYVPDVEREARLRIITKKPVRPSAAELHRNPRARSARLRVAERMQRRT
jgi:16S rRNA (cytosine1402-N4)-methyltransferase